MTAAETALTSLLEETATGYMAASVLFAAVELGLIDALAEPCTVEELAQRTGATADGLARLCRVLAGMGLLHREGNRFLAPAPLRAVLGEQGDASIAAVLRHHHRHVAPLLSRLAEGVRSGKPQHAAWRFASAPPAEAPYAELARHPDEYATFLAAMDHASRGVGDAIVRTVDLSAVRSLVDLGGGGGQVARELLGALPLVRIEGFDVAAACSFARARSAAAGFSERHTVAPGDLLDECPVRDADAVLLSAILADWTSSERAIILRRAYDALRPGGRLLVSETLLDDDRRGPPKPAMLSLVMLVAMRGDQLTESELRAELAAAGFSSVRVHRMAPRDLVVAHR
ncbi:methyltransferase [Pendulispora albinea]|uniref:Acetylserotonin O-methyltransferase n=1 Tax=Pendulispora albinea TaxID=2741071 RepID=A0ABZ2LW34_9BACT